MTRAQIIHLLIELFIERTRRTTEVIYIHVIYRIGKI
jgi:hypothetical protein